MASIQQIISTHTDILNMRESLKTLFNFIAPCKVTVGGSYMLKYWDEAFKNREIHDYDFIIHADRQGYFKIFSFLKRLSEINNYGPGSYDSFYLGKLHGKSINVIPKVSDRLPISIFESLEDIIKVKKQWVEKAVKENKKPRYKDLKDIEIYNLIINLPF